MPLFDGKGHFFLRGGVDVLGFFFQLIGDSDSNLKSYDKSYCEASDLSKILMDWIFNRWQGLDG